MKALLPWPFLITLSMWSDKVSKNTQMKRFAYK